MKELIDNFIAKWEPKELNQKAQFNKDLNVVINKFKDQIVELVEDVNNNAEIAQNLSNN